MDNQDDINNKYFIDIQNIPDSILNPGNINIGIANLLNENNYKVYKYIDIKDIDIILSSTHRIDEPWEKIESLKPLSYYTDKENKEEYSKLINMLNSVSDDEINDINMMQEKFLEGVPIDIKYHQDYLWQIYYLNKSDKYVMIVPTEEHEQQAFKYLLYKKINGNEGKIYVPICNGVYNYSLIKEPKIKKIENYLYFFTNNWPKTFNVFDKENKISLVITGKLNIHSNISSDYKMEFSEEDSENGIIDEFFELLDRLFYIQTELSNYFLLNIYIDENGRLHFYYNDMELTNSNLQDFYSEEINNSINKIKEVDKIQVELLNKLHYLKKQEKTLKTELAYKQNQISTFLECKKTFFGKVKFFFKHSAKKQPRRLKTKDTEEIIEQEEAHIIEDINCNNDIEDLIYVCKQLKSKTILASTTRMDMQNLTTRIEILKKKIENANAYIKEIESHKKSIFDFWKYTNKDEKAQLTQAESIKEENNRKY